MDMQGQRFVTGPDGAFEFGVCTGADTLPLTACPTYLKESIGGVCEAGSALIVVFNIRFRITPGMVFTLLPWQLVSLKEVSDDFRVTYFRVSQQMFTDTLSSLWRLTPGFLFYMRRHIASEADPGTIARFRNYASLLLYRMEHAPLNCRRESIMQQLRVYYWDIYTVYISDPEANRNIKYTRKEEYAFRFLCMIIEGHSPDLDVAYYADRLGVSPKYLTNLIRSISGQSAREWIVYYTILEIKSLLRESSLELKTISSRTNFPDQSTMSRFFRRYTGMTPSQYRREILF